MRQKLLLTIALLISLLSIGCAKSEALNESQNERSEKQDISEKKNETEEAEETNETDETSGVSDEETIELDNTVGEFYTDISNEYAIDIVNTYKDHTLHRINELITTRENVTFRITKVESEKIKKEGDLFHSLLIEIYNESDELIQMPLIVDLYNHNKMIRLGEFDTFAPDWYRTSSKATYPKVKLDGYLAPGHKRQGYLACRFSETEEILFLRVTIGYEKIIINLDPDSQVEYVDYENAREPVETLEMSSTISTLNVESRFYGFDFNVVNTRYGDLEALKTMAAISNDQEAYDLLSESKQSEVYASKSILNDFSHWQEQGKKANVILIDVEIKNNSEKNVSKDFLNNLRFFSLNSQGHQQLAHNYNGVEGLDVGQSMIRTYYIEIPDQVTIEDYVLLLMLDPYFDDYHYIQLEEK